MADWEHLYRALLAEAYSRITCIVEQSSATRETANAVTARRFWFAFDELPLSELASAEMLPRSAANRASELVAMAPVPLPGGARDVWWRIVRVPVGLEAVPKVWRVATVIIFRGDACSRHWQREPVSHRALPNR